MNELDKIYSEESTVKAFSKAYLEYVSSVLEKISLDEIEQFVKSLLAARDRGSAVYFMGNGGSAATASHFANDIAIGTRLHDKPFRVISLCDNHAVITAIANDDGYEQIFSRQLGVLLKKDDVVVAISASGNSENLLCGIDMAKQKGAITVGLTAFDGGKLRGVVDMSVHVPTNKGEYGPAEDGHMVLDHLVGSYLMRFVKDQSL
jgi:D-sedoheptulose 7-phosphate isomerase